MPEKHLAAVALATVLAWSWYAFAAWQSPAWALAAPAVFGPFGFWLRDAYYTVRQQHRLAAAWNQRIAAQAAQREENTK